MATSWRVFSDTFSSEMSARRWGRPGRGVVGAALMVAWVVWPWAVRSENRLADEKSPYLLLHKENPVEWYPWGAEAFARAKRENKPVFVSIGYSACHWCHVMARESFENRETAQLLNEHFINVKVDREERPDVDRLCMAFVQAATGSGGWPMNVWMTPEGEPFFGGTYFPPEDLPGRPSFRTVIRQVAEGWVADEAGIRAHGGKVLSALRAGSASKPPEAATGMVRSAYEDLVRAYDPQWGGFGTQEKFPQASALNFLVRLYASGPGSPEGQAALEMVRNSLSKMAAGGIRDHLGGGFHRYAVDRAWHVPHFEKMLSDQAQLAAIYGAAWQVTGDPLFEEIARETLDHVLRDLAHPEGGFLTAMDAESLVTPDGSTRGEGAYYVWSVDEIDDALNADERRLCNLHYGVKPEGNVPAAADPRGELKGKNVLSVQQSIAETARELNLSIPAVDQMLAGIKGKLRVVRDRRPSPRRDEKILTAGNGLMISACARVGAAFQDERYVAAAAKAARFLRRHLYDARSGTLRRSWNREATAIPGFAEDYAFLIQGLLDLYEVTADSEALVWAIALQKKQNELFWDSKAGGYFCSMADPLVKARLKQDYDGAEPAANSVSALNLLRLSHMLHDDQYAQRANGIFRALAPALDDAPASVPQLVSAWQFAQAETRQAVIAGDPQSESGRRLARSLFRNLHPDLVVLYSKDAAFLSGDAASLVAAMRPVEGLAALYVCENFVCREPVTSPEKAHRLLARTRKIDQKGEDANGR